MKDLGVYVSKLDGYSTFKASGLNWEDKIGKACGSEGKTDS